MVMKDSF